MQTASPCTVVAAGRVIGERRHQFLPNAQEKRGKPVRPVGYCVDISAAFRRSMAAAAGADDGDTGRVIGECAAGRWADWRCGKSVRPELTPGSPKIAHRTLVEGLAG